MRYRVIGIFVGITLTAWVWFFWLAPTKPVDSALAKGDRSNSPQNTAQDSGVGEGENCDIGSENGGMVYRAEDPAVSANYLQEYEEILAGWYFVESMVSSEAKNWALYLAAVDGVIARSPASKHLETRYVFLNPEEFRDIGQSEGIVARNLLIEELQYLQENGVEWIDASSERGAALADGILRSTHLLAYPAETLLRMPQFGVQNSQALSDKTELLQSIRLEFLLEYSKQMLRHDQTTGLLQDPRFAAGQGQSFLMQEIELAARSMQEMRVAYLHALAEAVNAPSFPDL